MAGQFSSARKQVVDALRRDAAALVNRHAFGVLQASNREIPQVGKSLGYATNALRSSGHVLLAGSEGKRRNGDAYDLAVSDAMHAREENRDKTRNPGIVEPLTWGDFLPRYDLQETPAVARAVVYYPVRYAMALEMGYTLRGMMHPQAFFLMRAVDSRESAFRADVANLLKSLERIECAPFKVKLSPAEIEMRDRGRMERAVNAQFRRESGVTGKYGPFESFAEMLEASGESRKRGKGENFAEAAQRVRDAAFSAFENGSFQKRG